MTLRGVSLASVAALFAVIAPVSANQSAQDQSKAVPILWKDPGKVADRDLFWGSGDSTKAPKAPFTFVAEDATGTNPKITVTDAQGMKWSVKFATSESKNEVHSEVAASRLVWALGYMVEDVYFVASGRIEGATKLNRARESVAADGTFTAARFESRDPAMQRTGRTWSLDKNPFKDTRELSGLKIMLAMLSNWDTKESNTDILEVRTPAGPLEARYIISDLGATFGKMGSGPDFLTGRSRWDLEDFQKSPFVKEVKDGKLALRYTGVATIDDVPLEHARWFSGLASQLTETQVRRAFEAAGATEAEVMGYSARLLQKIGELRDAVGLSTGVGSSAPTRRLVP